MCKCYKRIIRTHFQPRWKHCDKKTIMHETTHSQWTGISCKKLVIHYSSCLSKKKITINCIIAIKYLTINRYHNIWYCQALCMYVCTYIYIYTHMYMCIYRWLKCWNVMEGIKKAKRNIIQQWLNCELENM